MLGLERLKGTVFLCILKTEELPTVSTSGPIAKSAEIIWRFLPWALRAPQIPISLLCLQLALFFRVNTRSTADCKNRGRTTEGAVPSRWWFDINSSFISENISLLLSLQHDRVGEFGLHNAWTKIFLKISTKYQETRGIVFFNFPVSPNSASHCFWARYAVCFVLRTCDLVDNAWVTFI